MKTYDEALAWIHSTMRFGSKPGLHRIARLLNLLGNPEKEPEYIHVAGTNGKGSVTAMAASILRAAGYRTGMYISPYLEDFRERMTINGKRIPEKNLMDLANQVRPGVEQMVEKGEEHPTEFEIITAMAFLYFAMENCDFVSLEVGLGGRFDATNVVEPAVSIITTISFDHTDRLGNTLAEIAFEKAGTIKQGVPVVTGVVEDESFGVISSVAGKLKAPLYQVKQGLNQTPDRASQTVTCVSWSQVSSSLCGQAIDVTGPGFHHSNLRVPLLGEYQQQNAAVAVAAVEAARKRTSRKPVHTGPEAIRAGLAATRWPGRFEILSRNPAIILDVAHNPEGIRALSQAVRNVPRDKLICIYGILADKPYRESTAFIAPLCDEVILTKPDSPRSLEPAVLAEEARKHTQKITVEPDLRRAFDLALEKAEPDDAILSCGSLYLIGPLRTHIRKRLGITDSTWE